MTTLASGRGYTEGPAYLGSNRVAFTSMAEGRVIILEHGEIVREVSTGGGPTGLVKDVSGSLYVVQNNGQWGSPNNAVALLCRIVGELVEPVRNLPLMAPNDACFGPDGRLYITDPIGQEALTNAVPGRVFALNVDSGDIELISDDLLFPNGLAFDSQGRLFVAETFPGRIVRLDPRHGQTWRPTVLADTVDGQPDGIAFDTEDRLWVAVNKSDSVQVFDPSGLLVDRVDMGVGSYPSNLCFGDEGTLYVTTAGMGGLAEVTVDATGLKLHTGIATDVTEGKSHG
jgi:gluconolactonase